MKLLRYGAPGAEKPGLLHEGSIRDLSAIVPDIAGAAIGNNVGDGDAQRGAAIGAAVGGAAGAYKGYREDQRVQGRQGPNGGDLYYDERARRYFYVDRDGCTYWQNGQYRGC